MILRKARPDEAEALTELALKSKRAWGYDESFMQRVLPDMIVHPEYLVSEHGIVAEADGRVAGYAIVRVDERGAYLRDLFVDPAKFRAGIGRALFLAAIDFARERGALEITLVGDPNAVGFYERVGMEHVGEEPSLAGGGRMLPVMRKEIV